MASPRPLASKSQIDYNFKIVLIGQQSVGKTHLMRCYINEDGDIPATTATLGADFESKILSCRGQRVRAQIWDTAGQERYKSLTLTYFRRAQGSLIVFDVTNRDSFGAAAKWLQELRENADQDCVAFLVGNKLDLCLADPLAREVPKEEAELFAKENALHYVETSAVTNNNVGNAFGTLVREVYDTYVGAKKDSQRPQESISTASTSVTISSMLTPKQSGGSCAC